MLAWVSESWSTYGHPEEVEIAKLSNIREARWTTSQPNKAWTGHPWIPLDCYRNHERHLTQADWLLGKG